MVGPVFSVEGLGGKSGLVEGTVNLLDWMSGVVRRKSLFDGSVCLHG